jgi:hypothetical protein
MDTADSTSFNFTTNLFTINIWVEPTSSTNHYFMQTCDNETNNGWYLYYASYQVYFASITNGSGSAIATPDNQAAGNGAWHMLTIVRSAVTNTTLYVDGLPVASTNLQSPGPSGASLKFAVDPSGTDYYDGNLWLPQIWGESLPATSIANLYFNQRSGVPWP